MKNLSLNAKISVIISIFIVGYIGISVMSLGKMSEIKDNFDEMARVLSVRVSEAHELKELFLIQLINEKNFILSQTPDFRALQDKRLNDRNTQIRELLVENKKIATPKDKEDLEKFLVIYEKWWTMIQEERSEIASGHISEASSISMTKGRDLRLQIEAVIDEIVKRNSDVMISNAEDADLEYTQSRSMVLITIALTLLLGISIAFFTLRSLGRAIDGIIENLNNNSEQVSSAASQIASTSEELSHASSEQASSLEQTAASIEEMSSMVKKNAENSIRTTSLTKNTSESAQKGKEVMQEMVKAITEIERSNSSVLSEVDQSNERISEIVDLIAEIGEKTKVINDIVFQTKLLSFNASVEAARAGEHGKGFAVVAEEVGSLAQMSGNAAKEIAELLGNSKSQVEKIVSETKSRVGSIIDVSRSKVEQGNKIANDCSQVLEEIFNNIKTVDQMSRDISHATQEQAQGVQEISRAMTTLDEVTQTNASTSEEAASAATQLSSQAESLNHTVELLVLTIRGHQETHHSKKRAPTKAQKEMPLSHNVIELPKADKVEAESSLKMASSTTHDNFPKEDDPRFKEI